MIAHDDGYAAAIRLDALTADPYPIYRELRQRPPAFVPAANRVLVTRHADIVALERQPEIFSAFEAESLMTRVMGHSLLRKDGAAHRRERAACEPSVRPAVIKTKWMPTFTRIVNALIDGFIDEEAVDLFDRFAGPCAALSLAHLLGLYGVDPSDLCIWSQAMMDAVGNYGNDAEIWRRGEAATTAIDAALDEAIVHLKQHPDESIISSMLQAADPLSRAEISANVKVIIGGGLNEPRDAIATAIYALLADPPQRLKVEADPSQWRNVFEETVRWVAPIGMYPRQTTQKVVLGGATLEAGTRIGVVLGAANRDETIFENPDAFDIGRPKKPHVAFGGGPHFCLGAWVARAQVGDIALPILFRRLSNLKLAAESVRFSGWVFRGPLNLPVTWRNQQVAAVA